MTLSFKPIAQFFLLVVVVLSSQVSPSRAQDSSTPDFSGNSPHWYQASNVDCWIYDASYNPPPWSRSWSGKCVAKVAQGPGTMTVSYQGSVSYSHSGVFDRGVLNGPGELIYYQPNGNESVIIDGIFDQDRLHGSAKTIFFNDDGSKIITTEEFDDNGAQVIPITGSGTEIDPSGNSHPGQWVVDQTGSNSNFVEDDELASEAQEQADSSQVEQQAQVNQQILSMIAGGVAQSVGQLAQAQRNIALTHEQVQQELAARNQQVAQAPIYTPPPAIQAPLESAPNQQVASTGSSGVDTVPVAESCISNFYNPNSYNWFTWKDNCSYPVNVYFMLKNGSGINGEAIVNPGDDASGNTGLSQSEVNQGGGYVWGACPQGYGAFDYVTNQRWRPSSTQYYCKKTGTGA